MRFAWFQMFQQEKMNLNNKCIFTRVVKCVLILNDQTTIGNTIMWCEWAYTVIVRFVYTPDGIYRFCLLIKHARIYQRNCF